MTEGLHANDETVWQRYMAFKKSLELTLEAQLRGNQLSESDYAVLEVVAAEPGNSARVKTIARVTGWESSRLAHQLRRMEKRELIFRMPCPKDARGTIVSLTREGVSAYEETQPGRTEVIYDQFLGKLSPEQKMRLLDVLESLVPVQATDEDISIDLRDETLAQQAVVSSASALR